MRVSNSASESHDPDMIASASLGSGVAAGPLETLASAPLMEAANADLRGFQREASCQQFRLACCFAAGRSSVRSLPPSVGVRPAKARSWWPAASCRQTCKGGRQGGDLSVAGNERRVSVGNKQPQHQHRKSCTYYRHRDGDEAFGVIAQVMGRQELSGRPAAKRAGKDYSKGYEPDDRWREHRHEIPKNTSDFGGQTK